MDGVTNSVQLGHTESLELSKEDKQNLEQEIAEKFKLHENSLENWNSFVNKFYNECKTRYPKIFKTKEDLKTLNLIIGITDRGDIWINDFEFYFSVSFKKAVQIDFIDFYKTKFFGKVDLTSKEFRGRTFFQETSFGSGVEFHNSAFVTDVTFAGTYLDGEIDFFLAKFAKNVSILGVKFGKNTKLRFTRSTFSGDHFEIHSHEGSNPVKEIHLDGAVFHCPAVFDLKFESCPDFSKAHFLSKVIINETWLNEGQTIGDSEIKAEHENKFRFLKKYFSDQGNHFKEQEYFGYEMMARNKSLRAKVFSFLEIKNFRSWFKNVSELVLFSAYKATSNFGMSWVRPLVWLSFSAVVMRYYVLVPAQNYFGFLNEFFVFRLEDISFKDAVIKTISPLSTAEEFKGNLIVKIHCLLNASLIFLLGLGLRNKFKIK